MQKQMDAKTAQVHQHPQILFNMWQNLLKKHCTIQKTHMDYQKFVNHIFIGQDIVVTAIETNHVSINK